MTHRASNGSLAAIGLHALLAFAASWLAFAIVDGRASDRWAAAVIMALAFSAGSIIVASRKAGSRRHALEAGDVAAIVAGAAAGGAIAALLTVVVPASIGLELGPVIVATVIVALLSVGLRLCQLEIAKLRSDRRPGAQRTIVVGSGGAAASLVRLFQEDENFRYRVIGCVDDAALSRRVAGKPVLGTVDELPSLIAKHLVTCVIIAIPSAPAALVKRIINCCATSARSKELPPTVKILPGVLELLNDGVKLHRIRPVQPEDLLPREPVKVDLAEIAPHVENRVILVTGAGGSIGSELCRQIVGLNPSLLLLLGHGENSLFAIDEELRLRFDFDRTKIILADVADSARISGVFAKYRPHVVFHAAAHKHVPIVEANVCEAARNNVLGTHVVSLAASAYGVAKFVLLSTDKAVNPTSVMGATKRLSEIISQSFVHKTGTEFVTVRFGNVLESRGSVIPIFKKQIENGGPITITHRDMQRYFMTIPEAVSLVLQAMAIGRDGEVLVLDMGQPVNILKLAETLITLSGLTPYRDISIVETGIRPGEKLFEEILTNLEGMSTTSHSRLFIAQQERIAYETLAVGLRALERAARAGDQDVIVEILRDFVPTYQPGQHFLNGKAAAVTDSAAAALASASPQNGRVAAGSNGAAVAAGGNGAAAAASGNGAAAAASGNGAPTAASGNGAVKEGSQTAGAVGS